MEKLTKQKLYDEDFTARPQFSGIAWPNDITTQNTPSHVLARSIRTPHVSFLITTLSWTLESLTKLIY